jgi:hypothetical protein
MELIHVSKQITKKRTGGLLIAKPLKRLVSHLLPSDHRTEVRC